MNTPTSAGNVEGNERKEKGVEGIASGRLDGAEEVANVVVFLFVEGGE